MRLIKQEILKITCPSWWWKLYHNLHGDGVGVTDIGDIDSENKPFEPAYICDNHYENHFKRFSLREMKILESEELQWYEDNEDSWRLIKFLQGDKVWKEIQSH